MKVILLKKVSGLGSAGDIKEVSDGYAENFLIPQKMAKAANAKNVAIAKQAIEKKIRDAEKDLVATEKLANRLSEAVLEIKGKINDAGRLYAAVTSAVICDKLKEKGMAVDKKSIMLKEPIKELGDYRIRIVLDHGLEAEITVVVND